VLLFVYSWAGEEVLHGFQLQHDDLKAADIAVIQFDTRPLDDYWHASARWNKLYAQYHGHQYAYISMRAESCMCGGEEVAPAWCKVKAMMKASSLLPRAKAFVYMDSDAVVTSNHSLADIVGYMRQDLSWDLHEQPVAFNQDGPGLMTPAHASTTPFPSFLTAPSVYHNVPRLAGWSCKYTMELGYNYCLNSGTVFWLNIPKANAIIKGSLACPNPEQTRIDAGELPSIDYALTHTHTHTFTLSLSLSL
jgi:hypothetical protein